MPPTKRSKSEERERKREQRLKLSEEKKHAIKIKDAEKKKELRNDETKEEKLKRLENMIAYNKNKVDDKVSLQKKRRNKRRIRKGFSAMEMDGLAESWSTKSLKEMSSEERKMYDSHRKKCSRNFESEEKKEDLKKEDRKVKYQRRFARFRHQKTKDLRESEEDEDENYTNMAKRYLKWEKTNVKKYPFKLSKNEQDVVDKVRNRENVYKKPPLPPRVLCEYEKIREDIIKERVTAMENSGLFDDMADMKTKIFMDKLTN